MALCSSWLLWLAFVYACLHFSSSTVISSIIDGIFLLPYFSCRKKSPWREKNQPITVLPQYSLDYGPTEHFKMKVYRKEMTFKVPWKKSQSSDRQRVHVTFTWKVASFDFSSSIILSVLLISDSVSLATSTNAKNQILAAHRLVDKERISSKNNATVIIKRNCHNQTQMNAILFIYILEQAAHART